jgi:hypothetical protein
VTTAAFSEVKRQEAQGRTLALRKAAQSPQTAATLPKRASQVGNRPEWRITNFKLVDRARSTWA